MKQKIVLFVFLFALLTSLFSCQKNYKTDTFKSNVSSPDEIEINKDLDNSYRFWNIDLDSTHHYADLVIEKATEKHLTDLVIKAKISKAVAYNNSGELEKSKALLLASLSEIENEDNHPSLGSIYANLGIAHFYNFELYKALYYFETALELFRKTEGKESHIISCIFNIANIYSKTQKYDKALAMYNEAYKMAKDSNDDSAIGFIELNSGQVRIMEGNYDKAEDLIKRSIATNKRINQPLNVSLGYIYLSQILYFNGDYNGSLKILDSITTKAYEKNKLELVEINIYRAKNYRKLNQNDSAIIYAKDAVELGLDAELSLASEASKLLYELYSENNDFKNATLEAKRILNLSDTLYKQEFNTKFLQSQFDFEFKESKLKADNEHKKILHNQRLSLLFVIIFILIISSVLIFRKNNKLKKSLIQVKESNKIKDDFVAKMSHEIKTPLNIILGCNELLNKSTTNGNQLDYIAMIKKSTESLLNIANDVLEVSWKDKSNFILNETSANLFYELNETVKIKKRKAEEKGLILTTSWDLMTDKWLLIDVPKFKQIINHLLSNAIKFTEKGEIHVVSKVVNYTKEFLTVEFCISDTGIGIKPENLSKVCEKFYQEESNINRTYDGSGLGLTITKKILTAMKSKLIIESTKNKGSSFKFSLRLKKDETYELPQKLDLNNSDTQFKILIAEDNKINLLLIKQLIYKICKHITLVSAKDGVEAIKEFKKEDFDLIIMDIQMPVCDGFEATVKIRSLQKYHVPIIACSASIVNGSYEEEKLKLFDGYIEKPIDIVKLENILQKYSIAAMEPRFS